VKSEETGEESVDPRRIMRCMTQPCTSIDVVAVGSEEPFRYCFLIATFYSVQLKLNRTILILFGYSAEEGD
jgi:hypothetical protein